MTTRKQILDTLNAYLNHQMTLNQLVNWGHTALLDSRFPPGEDSEMLMEILLHLAAADTQSYPLTWEAISEFLGHLGCDARVILKVA